MNVEIIQYTAAYVLVAVIIFFAMNFLSNGFFLTFVRVRGARGKKVLVNYETDTGVWPIVGLLNEEFISFKTFAGDTKRVRIPDGTLYQYSGVWALDVDSKTNVIRLRPSLDGVSSYDAVKFDQFLARNLQKPTMGQEQILKAIIVLVVLVLVIAVAGAYISYINGQELVNLKSVSGVI